MRKKIYFNPILMIFFMSIILIGSYILVDDNVYKTITNTEKIYSYNHDVILIYIFLVIGFIIGFFASWIISTLNKSNRKTYEFQYNINLIYKIAQLTFIVTSIGTIIWVGLLFINIGSISKLIYLLFNAKPIELRPYRTFIPGITTLTQVGPLCVVISYIAYKKVSSDKKKKRMIINIIILVIYALIRMRLNYERLAIIEIMVPLLIIYCYYCKDIIKIIKWSSILVLGVYSIFTFGEYFKSWQYYQYIVDTNIFIYSFYRLVSYYWTSINNGLFLMTHKMGLGTPLYFSLEWIWKFPVLNKVLDYVTIFNISPSQQVSDVLNSAQLNPEYNVFSTIGYAYWDFGVFGAFIFMIIMGTITGIIYNSFKRGRIFGMIIYPIWFIGVMEFYRIQYWSGSRQFITYFAAIICAFIVIYGSNKCNKIRSRKEVGLN